MWVSINGGAPKSSMLIGCFLINHPAIGVPHDYGTLHITYYCKYLLEAVGIFIDGSFLDAGSTAPM